MLSTDGYVLAVGLKNRLACGRDLPLNLCSVDTGAEALKNFRRKTPSVLLGLWDLPDMPNGELFRRILALASSVVTISLVEFGNFDAEVEARSIGVTIVLDDNVDDNFLADLLSQMSAGKVTSGK